MRERVSFVEPEDGGSDGLGILEAAIEDVLENRRDAESLWEIIHESADELAEMRSIFRTSISGQRPHVIDKCREEIIAVEYALDEYERTLGSLSTALKENNQEALSREGKAAGNLSEQINLAFLRFRDRAFLSAGPTGHGGINYLLALMGRLAKGEAREGELECEVNREREEAATLIATIGESENVFPVPQMKAFCERYADLLERLDFLIRVEEEELQDQEAEPDDLIEAVEELQEEAEEAKGESLDEIAREMEELGSEFERIDLYSQARNLAEGPTAVPFVNVLIRAGGLAADGKEPPEAMEYFLGEFADLLALHALRHKELMKFTSRSATLVETGDRIAAVLAQMEELLQEGRIAWNGPDPTLPEDWEPRLVDAAGRLDGMMKQLGEIAENENSVRCIRCGMSNQIGDFTCRSCKAVLPTAGIDAPSFVNMLIVGHEGAVMEEPKMTANVQRLFDAASGFLEGRGSREELEEILGRMERLLSISLRTAETGPPSHGKDDVEAASIEEAAGSYRLGLERFEEGLALFRRFASAPSRADLEAAGAAVWEGVSSLQHAQKILEPFVQRKG
jgi:hypothetical protein